MSTKQDIKVRCPCCDSLFEVEVDIHTITCMKRIILNKNESNKDTIGCS